MLVVRFNKYVVIYLYVYYEGRIHTVFKAICFINREFFDGRDRIAFTTSWNFGRTKSTLNLRLGVLSFTYVYTQQYIKN